MSSQKGRDLAQELVDFLLKEDQHSGAPKNSTADPTENPAVPTPPIPTGDDKKPKMSKPAMSSPSAPPLPEIPPPVPKVAMAARESGKVFGKEDPKTFVLGDMGQDLPEGDAKNDTRADTKPVLKPDIFLEFPTPGKASEEPELTPESVNFIVPSERAKEIFQRSERPEPAKTEEFVFQPTAQGFTTQRSKAVFNEVSSLMAGVEAVKVAQARISMLERERDKLRDESEQLLTASEGLQRRIQELKAQNDSLERKQKEKIEILEDEKAVFKSRLTAKEDELELVKKENEELKLRFQMDLRKIRVRERELETRLEIMKAEHTSVLKVKDETIMELKRHFEKLQFELDNFRAQAAEMNARIAEFYEKNHRTVKALRLALSVLETGDSDDKPRKVG